MLGVAAELDEVPHETVGERVVPAPDVQAWHRDAGVVAVDAPAMPVGVVGRVVEPLAEVRGVTLERRRPGVDRQRPVQAVRAAERPEQLVQAVDVPRAACRVGREERRPGRRERERERPAAVGPAVVVLRAREARADRGERGRPLRRRQQLDRAGVGEAVHPDAAVAARQGGGPLDRVVAVLRLVRERREHAVGGVPAARVLDDDEVALAGVPGWVRVPEVAVRGGLVVGQADQQDGVHPTAERAVDVGPQHRAVAHGQLDAALDLDAEQRIQCLSHAAGP